MFNDTIIYIVDGLTIWKAGNLYVEPTGHPLQNGKNTILII